MKLQYKNNDFKRDEQFISLFALGIVSALKENNISCDDAWNWLLNIRTLEKLEEKNFSKEIINAIHLGTELGDVKRIVPDAFISSCDQIIKILKEVLRKNLLNSEEINYFLEIKD